MSIIIYIIESLNIIKEGFKNLHIKSLRLASTKRIWKAIFIEETRSLCYAPSGIPKYFRRKCMSNMYFLGRNAFLTFLKETLNLSKWCIFHIQIKFFLAHYGLDFGPKNRNRVFTSTKSIWRGTFNEETRSLCEVAKHFFVFLQWKWPSKCVLLRPNANFSYVVF